MGKSRTSPLTRTTSGGIPKVTGANVQQVAGASSQQTAQTQQQATTQVSAQDLVDASKIVSIYGNDTASKFAKMSDDQLARAVTSSKNVDMPDHIADVRNFTQQFVYENQLNSKPTVLDSKAFDSYIKTNNISDSQVLAREVDPISFTTRNNVKINYTSQDVADIFKAGDINYIGGKRGGSLYGYGSYFANVGINGSTGYGSSRKAVVRAVLSKDARCIKRDDINSEWSSFVSKRPKLKNAVSGAISNIGDDYSVKALLMGYNVITSDTPARGKYAMDTYFNVLDRSAVVCRAD